MSYRIMQTLITMGIEGTHRMAGSGLSVGVIGVGSMGKHHARVYNSLDGVNLVGVTDVDEERAADVAAHHGTDAWPLHSLIKAVDAVSIAVPTEYHHEIASKCLENDVDVLIEKPLVRDLSEGSELIRQAETTDAVLQVGHIERFNPAVLALENILQAKNIIALNAERLGPPLERDISDSAVLDLMIHDIDIVCSLVGNSPTSIIGAGVRGNRHATATLTFECDIIAELTASRLTQKKIRKLDIVTEDCLVRVDYIDRSIEIHRASTPEFIQEDENIRYRHESIVERPMVDSTEPLQNELSSFVEAVRERSQPAVTGEDGLEAVHIAQQIDESDEMGASEVVVPDFREVSLD